ncbi:MAG: hypothetical protein GKC09_07700 [Methanosarcinales archaeon]|nr:hypothetical protein [Methanosarcinales archaeon]
MIRSGDQFIAGRSGGVIGAIIPWRGGFAGVAPAHIFQQVGTRELRLGGITCRVSYIPGDADLAFFPILAPCQLTILGKPHPGEAELVNARHSSACRVSDSSWSIVYVILPPGDLPGPGDSGSALVQDERVVGLLLSLNMHTCRGTAVSAEMIEREIGK